MSRELFPERDCRSCTDYNKVLWGCEGGALMPMAILGEMSDVCIARPWLDDWAVYGYVFQRYNGYKRGFLPDEGGLNSQPCKLVEMFAVIEEALANCEKERERRRKARDTFARHRQTINTPGGRP